MGMMFGLGFILGPFLGGKLADWHTVSWFNFSTPFWVSGTLSLINVILIWLWFRETLHLPNAGSYISLKTGFRNLYRAFSDTGLRTIFIVSFLSIFGFTSFTQFFQVYLITKFEFNQAQIGMTYAYMGLWIALTQGVVMRVLTRRFTPVRILPFSLLALRLSLVTLLIPERSSQLYFLLPLVSLAQGVSTPNITAIISNSVGMQDQGEILGINGSVQAVAFAIPPVVAGFVTAIDFRLPLTMAALCTFAAWLIYVRLFPGASRKGAITT
jgi:DHA1 family tetracycline resistance protein-like MFS transporter